MGRTPPRLWDAAGRGRDTQLRTRLRPAWDALRVGLLVSAVRLPLGLGSARLTTSNLQRSPCRQCRVEVHLLHLPDHHVDDFFGTGIAGHELVAQRVEASLEVEDVLSVPGAVVGPREGEAVLPAAAQGPDRIDVGGL